MIRRCLCLLVLMFLPAGKSFALPLLEQPVPLPADFQGVITIYPDSQNTSAIRRYWLVPSTARIVRGSDGKLGFGLHHSGLTSLDPAGVNALLTVTVQPYVDDSTLARAKSLVNDRARSEGATSVTFSFVTPREMKAWLMVGGHPSDFWKGTGSEATQGGTVEAGYVFQVRVSDDFDVRALTQAGADAASTIGARFTMKFDGLTDRCSFSVTAKFKEVYDHYKLVVSGSGWFGLTRATGKVEWQSLKGQNWVHFQSAGCSDVTIEKYYGMKLVDALLTQLAARTGQFAPQIHPSGLPDAPGGGGIFGWSFNAGGGYEHVDEERDLEYSVNIQDRVTEEIAFGMSFPTASTDLLPYIKNLTDTDKPLPTGADIKKVAVENKACITEKIAFLKGLFDQGSISQAFYQSQVANAVSRGCYGGNAFLTRLTSLISTPAAKTAASTRAVEVMRDAILRNEQLLSLYLNKR
jgi:hypothetical protein